MLQHLPSRQSNRQVEWPAGAFLEPWLTFSLPSNMQELSGLRLGQTKENITAMEIGWGPPPPIFCSQITPMKNINNAAVFSSSLQHSKPTYWQISNCLSCSLLSITQSYPMIQANQSSVCHKKKAQGYSLHRYKKSSLKFSSNEKELEESRLVFREGHNWVSGLPWVQRFSDKKRPAHKKH